MSADVPESLELHDARIESVRVLPPGRVEIQFRHISAFIRGHGGTEVWSCTGCLVLTGVSRLHIDGVLANDDYVTEGAVRNALGEAMQLADWAMVWGGPGTLDFLMAGSGARLVASFANFRMEHCRAGRLLEPL